MIPTALQIERHKRKISAILLALCFLFSLCFASGSSWAAQKHSLLMGLEPEHNIFDQVLRYRELSEYLSEQLGVEVKLTIMSRYGEAVKRFRSLHLDGAVLSAFTTMLAINDLGLTPVASLVREDGSYTSMGIILVRKDSGITNVNDMRNKSVVFVDPSTTEGYVFARAFFRSGGVDDLGTYFNRYYFSGSHASAVYAVLDGRAEVGAAKNTVYDKLVSRDPSIANELHIIAQSPPVPEITLCVKNDLDPQLMDKLRASLLKMDQTVEGHRVLRLMEAKRFTLTGPDDFTIVSELLQEAGLHEKGSDNSQ